MIYLVRHGLDDEKYIGGYSNVALTKEGISQVERLAKFLKNNNYKFEKIVSSDILRARQTSEIIAKELGLEIEFNPLLRELNKGKLNGMLKEKANTEFPLFMKGITIETKYPDGESMIEFYERIKDSLERILKLDNKLLVTHRGVINMLYYLLNDISVDMNKERFGVEHATLHELDPKTKIIKKVGI